MNIGELVRFRYKYLGRLTNSGKEIYSDWQMGLLTAYETGGTIAKILQGTKTVRVHTRNVQAIGTKIETQKNNLRHAAPPREITRN